MISVVTPTCRPELLPVIERCLSRQTYTSFEWIIVAPQDLHLEIDRQVGHGTEMYTLLSDPPKKEGDFWSLSKAWNKAYAHARGELIVNIQDGIWFAPDMLERFWRHYTALPKALVTVVGNQYDQIDDRGKPTNCIWEDPRRKAGFAKVDPAEMEMCVCSIPRQALLDCGGIDEEYDLGPAVGEKEMCLRLRVLGYENYQDSDIEYRAIKHPRLTTDWDEKYWKITAPMFQRHVKELGEGVRPLNVGFLGMYNQDSSNL